MPLTRPTVLILSNSAAFVRQVAAHWPGDSRPPEFTILEKSLVHGLEGCQYDLAIADAISSKSHGEVKKAIAEAGRPAILIHCDPSLPFSQANGSVVELYGKSGDGAWAAMAGVLGREILSRSHAEARARDAETACADAQAEATLGRYMIEMRHNVNNALTTILGNAELVTLEPGLPAKAIAQADSIRNMALRLHEMFQRFSSLEKELSVVARESGKASPVRATASGK